MIGVRLLPSRVASSAGVASIALTIALVFVTLSGCGGAAGEAGAPAAKSPESAGTSEPGSVEEAQAQIARAQAQLGGGGAAGSSASTSVPGATPSSAAPRSPSTSPAPPAADAARPIAEDRCGSPCRALASMRRAVTALCRMTGSEDARCSDAKRTLVDSEGRVAPCSC